MILNYDTLIEMQNDKMKNMYHNSVGFCLKQERITMKEKNTSGVRKVYISKKKNIYIFSCFKQKLNLKFKNKQDL